MVQQTFRVPDMHCSACVMRLEGIEDELPGIERVTASYRRQQMEVEYDPSRVSVAEIVTVVKEHGYEAIPV